MPSQLPCPKCGAHEFHKSHTRGYYEKLRKNLFHQQPYRCHQCGYRGWISASFLKPRKTLKDRLIYLFVLLIAIFVSLLLKNFLL